jgi:hypothetical protein
MISNSSAMQKAAGLHNSRQGQIDENIPISDEAATAAAGLGEALHEAAAGGRERCESCESWRELQASEPVLETQRVAQLPAA